MAATGAVSKAATTSALLGWYAQHQYSEGGGGDSFSYGAIIGIELRQDLRGPLSIAPQLTYYRANLKFKEHRFPFNYGDLLVPLRASWTLEGALFKKWAVWFGPRVSYNWTMGAKRFDYYLSNAVCESCVNSVTYGFGFGFGFAISSRGELSVSHARDLNPLYDGPSQVIAQDLTQVMATVRW